MMSVARNFRVTVNLSNFFHDHRNRARIFVNDDIQTISDLEDRIEKIFNIQNFHLTSQNEFLPPSEDARILQKDDIIWVMHNGDNYNSTHILKVASKKSDKKSKADRKKRSILSADEYIEEELRSPKKKKKKKSDIDDKSIEIDCNISSPLKELPKEKKKKKKASDSYNSGEAIEDVDMKSFSSPTDQKVKNKSKSIINISNDNKVSTTIEEGLNSPKNSVMNINTLLPVLQSHINTYNKKNSTNQLNKTNPCLAEISSSSLAKESESDDEKKKYTCKGNLPFYKRKIQLPTITDKYLNQKKINIVKIEYLGEPKATDKDKEENSRDDKNLSYQETIDKTSENNKSVVVEDQIKDIGLSKNYSMKSMSTKSDKEATDIPEANKTKLPETDTSVNGKAINVLDSQIILASNDKQMSLSKQEINNVCSKLETTFLSSQEFPLNDTKDVVNIGTKTILANDGTVANRPISTSKEIRNKSPKNIFSSPELDLLTLKSNKLKPGDGSSNKCSHITGTKKRVVLKKPNIPFHPKYFFFKDITSDNTINTEQITNSVFSNNVHPMPAKEDLLDTQTSLVNASDLRIKRINTESVTSQIENPSFKILKPDPLPKANDSKFPDASNDNITNLSCTENVDVSQSDKLAENIISLNDTVDKNLPTFDSQDYMINSIKDSRMELDNNSINSDISAIDLTKDVTSVCDSLSFSTRQESMSKLSKKKQYSGVGQLLDELRCNDSVISIESIDSDCSEFITKRQRKRIRKRKKKPINYNSESSLNSSPLITESPLQQKSMNVRGCPSIHIKFDEVEDGTELKITNLTKDNESYIENVTLRSDLDESRTEKPNIREEDILKSPSMKNMLPKIGDLIAFKILRITDNYTPEISSYITGKVIEFNIENKQIEFDILSGLDQCEEPKGKLSLEVDKNGVAATGSRREFIWIDLVDPRLLYP